MSGIMGGNADITNMGGGYGYGGGFGGLGLFGLLGIDSLGGRRDRDCCPQPATCESVAMCDRDVLETANETQTAISVSTGAIKDSVSVVGDKITAGVYALSNKMSDLAYLQQTTAKDTQNLIEKGNTAIIAAIETGSLKERNQYLEDKVANQDKNEILKAIYCLCGKDDK